MNEREKKVLELQAEIDFLNYISDYDDNYKKFDLQYHEKRINSEEPNDYDIEYNKTEIEKIIYQREHIKKFISKI